MLDELGPRNAYSIVWRLHLILLDGSAELHPHQKLPGLAPNGDDTVCPYSINAKRHGQ
jgi:hypothetical protein